MSGFPYYYEQVDYIARVTKMLNDLKPSEGVYLHVELRQTDDSKVIGDWSDEIAPDCWSYTETCSA